MVEFRTDPDDPVYFQQQTNFERAGYPDAWELTPGGRTVDGRQIVIAILDAGFDVTHEDLVDNLWRNEAEIPMNGLDDDGNGYVDDQFGWDMAGDDPFPPANAHGTQVLPSSLLPTPVLASKEGLVRTTPRGEICTRKWGALVF